MFFYTLQELEIAAALRAPGYLEECLKIGKEADGKFQFETGSLDKARKQFPHKIRSVSGEHSLPSAGQTIRNVGSAAWRLAKALLSGEDILRSESEVESIRAICHACEFYRKSDGRCAKCGCSLDNFIAKTKLKTEKCPVGKW